MLRRLALAALLTASTQALADSRTDYQLRSGALAVEPRQMLAPQFEGQREALGAGDVRILCFADGEVSLLILRVGERFYALNGTARNVAGGAEITWRGARHGIVDPYASKLPTADYMQRMIGPANRACGN